MNADLRRKQVAAAAAAASAITKARLEGFTPQPFLPQQLRWPQQHFQHHAQEYHSDPYRQFGHYGMSAAPYLKRNSSDSSSSSRESIMSPSVDTYTPFGGIPELEPASSSSVFTFSTDMPLEAAGSESLKDSHTSSSSTLEDDDVKDGFELLNSYLHHKYLRLRDRAFEERRLLGHGRSPLTSSLYHFWTQRLLHKFNRSMYTTFREIALEDDMIAGSREGKEHLFMFLRRTLSIYYRERLFKDFIFLVSSELDKHSYGVEQLWYFLNERSPKIRERSEVLTRGLIYSRPEMMRMFEQLDTFRTFT